MITNTKLSSACIATVLSVACGASPSTTPASPTPCMEGGYVVDARASEADRAWAARTRELASLSYEASLSWSSSTTAMATPADHVVRVSMQPKDEAVCAVLDCSMHPDGVEGQPLAEKQRVCPRALAMNVGVSITSAGGTLEQALHARVLSRVPGELAVNASRWDDPRLRQQLHVSADLQLQETLSLWVRAGERSGKLELLLHDPKESVGRGALVATWADHREP